MDPIDPELKFVEERRDGTEGMDRGADVVPKSRECQLFRACAATDGVGGLENEDRVSVACDLDGGSEPVRAGTDDYSVVLADFFLLSGFVTE